MENRINYIQLILALVFSFLGVLGGMWGAWEWFMKAEQQKAIDDKFKTVEYITVEDAANQIKEIVLEEREQAADQNVASLSWTVANALNCDRQQIAPRITSLIQYGEIEMAYSLERKRYWDDIINVIKGGVIYKKNNLGALIGYYRYVDGDYLIYWEQQDNGTYYAYWQSTNGVKHYLAEISGMNI